MNGNMILNNNYVMNNDNLVPAWAKAEHMEQCMGLNKIWKLSNKVHAKKQHVLRKKIAISLHQLANIVDEHVEERESAIGMVHSA